MTMKGAPSRDTSADRAKQRLTNQRKSRPINCLISTNVGPASMSATSGKWLGFVTNVSQILNILIFALLIVQSLTMNVERTAG